MNLAAPSERHRLAAVAAEWIARRDAGLDDAARAQLAAWCAADPAHAAALADAAELWGRLDRPREAGAATAVRLQMAAQTTRRRRRLVAVSAVACSVALGVVALLRSPPRESPAPTLAEKEPHLRLLQPGRQTLPDGSVVEFPAGTEFEIDFGVDFRRVKLLRGVAHFEVTPDSTRPFVVGSGLVAVRAVGTAFTVRPAADAVTVLVTEGRVAVQAVSRSGELRAEPLAVVGAGQSAAIPRARDAAARIPVMAVEETDIAAQHLWRQTRVEFSHATLAEVVETMNRHNRLQIASVDPALADVRLSGVFRVDDAETLLRFLERGFGIAVARPGPARAELRRATP